ncbi:MAG: ankyrin repeat domain-containing protein [Treponema sp.]|jgi:hypothetical protein|nr:ankyrin repeat domain-containing protein [Treponema sp.]
MKILLIYTQREKDIAGRVVSLIKGMGIMTEVLALKSSDDNHIGQFTSFFESPDNKEKQEQNAPNYILILSPLTAQWYDFFAGYSCGNHLPFLIFGHEAIPGISEEFASCFSFLKTIDSLQTFLEAEFKAFKKQEAAREVIRAQDALLRMGVPVTGESLAQSAGEGRIKEVSLFLAAGFSPDTRNKAGVPLLNIAARNGCREVLELLLQSGAEVNLTAADRGSSALIDSTIGRYIEIVNDLIESGADVDIQSKDGQTALLIAVGADDEAVVKALLNAGADADISDSLGLSARKYASLYKKKSILALFETCVFHKQAS